jgi:hypothetical protein
VETNALSSDSDLIRRSIWNVVGPGLQSQQSWAHFVFYNGNSIPRPVHEAQPSGGGGARRSRAAVAERGGGASLRRQVAAATTLS